MSSTAQRNFRRCRAVIVANDGQRYVTRWRQHKDINELEPDEMPPINKAIKAAERYADRKGIQVKRIDGQFTQPKETTL